VEKVERIERGTVGRRGRKVFSRQWGELAKSVTKEPVYWNEEIHDHIHPPPEHEDDHTIVFSHLTGNPWYSI
jgi:hypothetical protein